MQALIELLAGFIALLAAAALSQFGIQFDAPDRPEVHRVIECVDPVEIEPEAPAARPARC